VSGPGPDTWVACWSAHEGEGAVTTRDGRTDEQIWAGLCLSGGRILYEGPDEEEARRALAEALLW
jgi:hypothetical protein